MPMVMACIGNVSFGHLTFHCRRGWLVNLNLVPVPASVEYNSLTRVLSPRRQTIGICWAAGAVVFLNFASVYPISRLSLSSLLCRYCRRRWHWWRLSVKYCVTEPGKAGVRTATSYHLGERVSEEPLAKDKSIEFVKVVNHNSFYELDYCLQSGRITGMSWWWQ